MLQEHSRDKLLNAIIYFATNTKFCGKVKLYKLLYFLDFAHYTAVGRSVTGLDYFAWPKGPVPVDLHEQLAKPPDDMAHAMRVSMRRNWKGQEMLDIKPQRGFDATHFSKRELRLLQDLTSEFRDHYADDMIEVTHLENLPWHQVYEVEGRKQERIPYELAARKQEQEVTTRVASEHQEFVRNYEK